MKLWIEKRKRWRLRSRIDGRKIDVIKDLGIWEPLATEALVDCRKADAAGFVINPKSTTVLTDARAFLKAKKEGTDVPSQNKRIPIEEMCDLLIKHHGPSLKGGVSEHCSSSFYKWRSKIGVIKRAWAGKFSDEINPHDVRDFLGRYETVGTRMKYLRSISHMFSAFEEWNEDSAILSFKVKLPAANPGKKWRKKMKPSEKRELPDTRVLSPEEWAQFRPHCSPRLGAILEMALQRMMRKDDIKNISKLNIHGGNVMGLQQKTGDRYSVPALKSQPTRYDFTNFQQDFRKAQMAAGMDYPVGHPLHFSIKDLRRTGATWAYRYSNKPDIVSISEMLGHRDIATTIRYLHITHADKVAIAAAVDKLAEGNGRQD